MIGARVLRRRPPAEPEPWDDDQADDDTSLVGQPAQALWTGGPALVTRAVTVVLWLALVTGPVALLLAATTSLGSDGPAVAATARPVDSSGQQAAVTEFASRYVVAWLTGVRGQEADLQPYVGSSAVQLPEQAWTVGPASTSGVRRLPDGDWQVTVSLPVSPPPPTTGGGAVSAPVRRYYAVPVHQDRTGLVALALPAPVPAPQPASTVVKLAYRYPAASGDPLVESLQEFAGALLAGAGDVTRYTAPGSQLAAVTPPLFSSVQVAGVATDRQLPGGGAIPADGTRMRVLLDVSGSTGGPEQRVSVQYPLSLAVRGGRWEVTGLDLTPAQQARTTDVAPPTPRT